MGKIQISDENQTDLWPVSLLMLVTKNAAKIYVCTFASMCTPFESHLHELFFLHILQFDIYIVYLYMSLYLNSIN